MNQLVGFYYNDGTSGKEYLYQRNILGDIVGILNDEGELMGEYFYDAYGNHKVEIPENVTSNIAELNPFRYRGYFWDEETNFYYLNARYYDPETGRFISPDTLSILDETRGQINGLNLYMYCGDNPVMYVDPSGHWKLPGWLKYLLMTTLGAVGYAFVGANEAYESAKSLGYEGGELFGYTLSGLLVGDYLVVKDNWDTISKDIIFEDYNFDFSENPYYSFWTAGLYAKELMRKYTPDMNRTTIGIYLELQTHYIFYLFGNSHATDGAYMGASKWNADRNAIIFELVASVFSIFSIGLKDLQDKLKFY